MYRTVLDSTRYEGPLVRLITFGATRDAQNWRMDRRALCVEHILRAGAYRTKLRHCFVPSIIHLPWLGGPGRTARGRHNWKKAPKNPGNPLVPPGRPPFARKKREDKSPGFCSRSFKDRDALRTCHIFRRSMIFNGTVKILIICYIWNRALFFNTNIHTNYGGGSSLFW